MKLFLSELLKCIGADIFPFIVLFYLGVLLGVLLGIFISGILKVIG